MAEILCINKNPRNNIYESITHIGGINPSGEKWKITQGQAIQYIESGKYTFYVDQGGDKVKVIVAISNYGNKYIKTENDGEEENNLLSLPECRY